MGDPQREAKRAERRRRLLQVIKPPSVSGRAMAAALVLCFLLTGLLVPVILHKEIWIDAEFVVGTWWLIWIAVLAAMLYQGHRVSDDHQLRDARSWNLGDFFKNWYSGGNAVDAINVSSIDSEACAVGCLIIAALPLLVGVIWLVVEIAIPGLIFVAYFMVRGQLAHVVNDKHHCKGNVIRSVAWGALWATLYTAPLAGLVWFVHFAANRVE
jgi:hypothetical protein